MLEIQAALIGVVPVRHLFVYGTVVVVMDT